MAGKASLRSRPLGSALRTRASTAAAAEPSAAAAEAEAEEEEEDRWAMVATDRPAGGEAPAPAGLAGRQQAQRWCWGRERPVAQQAVMSAVFKLNGMLGVYPRRSTDLRVGDISLDNFPSSV